MAAILVPEVDPKVDAELRRRWGLKLGDRVPVSLENARFEPNRARNMEAAGQCPPVPEGGPGKERLDTIVKEARRIGRIHNPHIGLEGAAAGAILAQNSKTGGKWDIKNLRDAKGRKLYSDARNFGNFLYGANSTAMGFSPTISDLGADLYSLWDNGTLEDEDEKIRDGQRYARLKCDQR